MGDLDGKIAFVTGAGSGLGREIVRTFARAGARVAVNDLRADAARAVHAELAAERAALECGPLVGDVAATALFLAGPGGSYFTGQVLSPNGGLVI